MPPKRDPSLQGIPSEAQRGKWRSGQGKGQHRPRDWSLERVSPRPCCGVLQRTERLGKGQLLKGGPCRPSGGPPLPHCISLTSDAPHAPRRKETTPSPFGKTHFLQSFWIRKSLQVPLQTFEKTLAVCRVWGIPQPALTIRLQWGLQGLQQAPPAARGSC